MRLLWEDGREKILKGLTTFEEVARVCEERIELKEEKETELAERYVEKKEERTFKEKPAEIKVDTKDLEEYRSRIARWLGKK